MRRVLMLLLSLLLTSFALPACSDDAPAGGDAAKDRGVEAAGRDARAEAGPADGAVDAPADATPTDAAADRAAGETSRDGSSGDATADTTSADATADTTSADTTADATSADTTADSGGIVVLQQCGPSSSVLCNVATEVCVISAYQTGITGRCLTVPSQCANNRTCACLGKQLVCQTTSSAIICSDGSQSNRLNCSCPAC